MTARRGSPGWARTQSSTRDSGWRYSPGDAEAGCRFVAVRDGDGFGGGFFDGVAEGGAGVGDGDADGTAGSGSSRGVPVTSGRASSEPRPAAAAWILPVSEPIAP